MPRWKFPEDRTVFVYTGPLQPILEPSRLAVQIFLEPECQTLANLSDLNHGYLPGGTVYTGSDGLLPQFYGPPDVTVLYARALGHTEVYELPALDETRITDLDLHEIWRGEALPQHGERKPPYLWVKSDGETFMVYDDGVPAPGGYSDIYTDIYY